MAPIAKPFRRSIGFLLHTRGMVGSGTKKGLPKQPSSNQADGEDQPLEGPPPERATISSATLRGTSS